MRWSEVEVAVPELAAAVVAMMDAHVHKTLATLRTDGAPRISGTEAKFADGELWWGSMGGAVKARDLQRDPRFALHSGSEDPPGWNGDAKVSGRAIEVTDVAERQRVLGPDHAGSGSHLFFADVLEISTVRIGDPRDHLVLEHWHHERGHRRWTRT
jgi:hypothetical protein